MLELKPVTSLTLLPSFLSTENVQLSANAVKWFYYLKFTNSVLCDISKWLYQHSLSRQVQTKSHKVQWRETSEIVSGMWRTFSGGGIKSLKSDHSISCNSTTSNQKERGIIFFCIIDIAASTYWKELHQCGKKKTPTVQGSVCNPGVNNAVRK